MDFSIKKYQNALALVITNDISPISLAQEDNIIEIISLDEKAPRIFDDLYIKTSFISKNDSDIRMIDFVEKLQNKISSNNLKKYSETFNLYDYKKMVEIISQFSRNNDEYFTEFLSSGNYYLPDLSGGINEAQWKYCHALAKYIKSYPGDSIKEDFLNYLCSLKNDANKSLTRRLKILHDKITDN